MCGAVLHKAPQPGSLRRRARHEHLLNARIRRIGPHPRVATVAVHLPRLPVIAQAFAEDFPQSFPCAAVVDRRDRLDPAREVPNHPVRGPDKELACDWVIVAVGEMEDARVLEEAADDRTHMDSLAETRDAGSQAAETTHDQIDRDTHLGSRVQRTDDVGVLQLVIWATIRAGRPAATCSIPRLMRSRKPWRIVAGATNTVGKPGRSERPVK